MTAQRITINNINKALPEGIELVRGNGYFYFIGGRCPEFEEAGVYTNHLTSYTIEEWVEAYWDKVNGLEEKREWSKSGKLLITRS